MSDALELTQQQQADYARYYLVLRTYACAGADDPRVDAAFDVAASLFDSEPQSPERFDKVMATIARELGL